MKFKYRAKSENGETVEDFIEADSEGGALLKLQQRGLYVMEIKKESPPFYKRELEIKNPFGGISDTDLLMFTRQLSVMLDSRVGIIESLRILSKQIENEKMKEIVVDIADKVEEGDPFSKALQRHRQVFSEFFIGVIESGEASGSLPKSLEYLEEHIERNSRFKKKLTGALIYPLFIIFVFSFVVAFLLFFVIPDLVEIVEDFDAELPFITRAMIGTSEFMIDWGPVILIVLAVLIFLFIRFKRTEKGKALFDEFILKLPVFGKFFKKVYLTYFSESMATLISSGLDVVKALEVTEGIVGNETYREIVSETRQGVKEGKEISSCLQRHPQYFSPLVTRMIIVGEKTGKMERILNSIVSFYRDEIERSMENYVKIAEPVLIIMLGLVVGGLVASILLPIFNLGAVM